MSLHPVLPMELWDLIFRHILADHWLLRIARVCRAFNSLAIALYLRRSKLAGLALSQTHLSLNAGTTSALYLSCFVRLESTTSSVECKLYTLELVRGLRALHGVIEKSSGLVELRLRWWKDAWRGGDSELTGALCDVLMAVAARSTGPVFVVSNAESDSSIHSFSTSDFGFHLPQRRRSWLQFGTDDHTETRSSFFSVIQAQRCNSIAHVSVSVVPSNGQNSPPFALIVFDRLHLVLRTSSKIFAEHLSMVLPYINLSLLHRLELQTDAIDPLVLSAFLSRHPKVQGLEYKSAAHTAVSGQLLCSPPPILPALTRIRCPDPAFLPLVLDSIAFSPQTSAVIFILSLRGESPAEQADFTAALQRIADWAAAQRQRSATTSSTGQPRMITVSLELHLVHGYSIAAPTLPGARIHIHGLTDCIRHLKIVAHSRDDVNSLLPWIRDVFRGLESFIIATSEPRKSGVGRRLGVEGWWKRWGRTYRAWWRIPLLSR
ncbi:hypothetical protein C8F01DRAFT_1245597 [Mycena amicta]|nr:hypothetical protein C8F01DRAFT_1245597 [Mycena amicta]